VSIDVIKDFLARLGWQVDEAGAQKFHKSLATATLRAAAFGATIQAAAASAYWGLYRMAEGQAQLLVLSESTGVAVARLEELDYVAGQTDSSAQALASSLKGLSQSMAGSLIGQGGLATFQRLGIRVKDANGHLRDTSDVLFEVGRKIKGMDRGKQEMFLGQLGIDRSLVRMLTTDIGDLSAAWHEMYAAAGTDAQQAAEASRSYLGEIKSIAAVLAMLAKSVAIAFVSRASGSVARLRKGIVENFGKISRVIQTIIGVVARLAEGIGVFALRIMRWIGGIVDWFSRLDGGTQNLVLAVAGLVAAWRFLNLSFLATPLGMVLAGITGLLLLLDDLQTYLEGGKFLIDWSPWAGQIRGVVDALRPLLSALGRLWDLVKGPLLAGVRLFASDFAAMFGGLLGAVISFVTAAAQLLTGDFSGALASVVRGVQWLGGIVGTVLGRVAQVVSGIGALFRQAFNQDAGDSLSFLMAMLGQVLGAVGSFVSAIQALFQGDLSGAVDAVLEMFQRLSDLAGAVLGRIGQIAGGVWSALKRAFGGGEEPAAETGLQNMRPVPFGEGAPAVPVLGPSPAFAAAPAGAGGTSYGDVNATAYITVEGAASPEATARAGGREQGRVNADLVRHGRGAAR